MCDPVQPRRPSGSGGAHPALLDNDLQTPVQKTGLHSFAPVEWLRSFKGRAAQLLKKAEEEIGPLVGGGVGGEGGEVEIWGGDS